MPKDVVVIGGGVGGLSAAIYARIAGHNVCLLEASESLGGKAAEIRSGRYRFDPGPSIVILIRIYEQLFRDAGRDMRSYLRFHRLDPISRVYFGNRPPIDLPSDRVQCEKLVDDIAPGDGESFRLLMRKLDLISPLVDKTIFARPFDRPMQLLNRDLFAMGLHLDVRQPYKSMVDSLFQSPLLRAFFYGFPSYGGQSYDSKALGAFLIPYLMIQEGVFYPEGGVSSIPKALHKLARELGVEVRTNAKVQTLVTERTRIRSAILTDGNDVRGEVFVSGVDRSTTKTWLGKRSPLKPSFSYFTVQLGITRKLQGLRHHTLLIPDQFEEGFQTLYRDRKLPMPPIVYLNETTGRDRSVAPKGCSNLFAVVTSPAIEPHIDWRQESKTYRDIVLQTLDDFGFPIDDDEIEVERIQSPLYFEEAHGNYHGSLYGPDEKHRLFGLFPMSNRDDQYRNLLYCGGSVQPGAGLPMVVLSGKFAARKI